MSKTAHDFSIVLLADESTKTKVELIRRQLPDSPVRVDPPHMTLLRGISTTAPISDQRLVTDLGPLIKPVMLLNSDVRVNKLSTLASRRYGPTAVVDLDIPAVIVKARRELIENLLNKGYLVEEIERTSYQPHLTLMLSVPLPTSNSVGQILKKGDIINFTDFAILRTRIRQADGLRLVDIVPSDIANN